ncbi:helix-turn-helix transcriptional regulator [Ferdinandcohnia quinoae]|uniref:Helix-turn-helix domain-containing protein n=1 Tax=Fredinandcohnia quinoae TaxID=2918902 RepID=A0AAW5E2C2_9BACI|nr:helix-turn-helix domain-containing protein [Fredinandcohnia sp. SECRCQ15]MCH1624919.1 helix-turn-helix domain-containing protein [Fredinandcohnia sp. SECRCQ15]
MEQTLKITNVLSDPTRYYIYQYIIKRKEDVTVQEIADSFDIHPNVARLHLTKLEDVNMLVSETKKTGKGGRPSRLYKLSDDLIQLNFPFRDYQLLAKITIETMASLGEIGRKALEETGKKFGEELIRHHLPASANSVHDLTFEQKLDILKAASTLAGFYPELSFNQDKTKVFLEINNCPFKEIAKENFEAVCGMHYSFLNGMFDLLFDDVELQEADNMMLGCESCRYKAFVAK